MDEWMKSVPYRKTKIMRLPSLKGRAFERLVAALLFALAALLAWSASRVSANTVEFAHVTSLHHVSGHRRAHVPMEPLLYERFRDSPVAAIRRGLPLRDAGLP